MAGKSIREPERDLPVRGEYDVVVLGGGPAGIAAAASVAGHGRKTLLVERYGFLGGMGTAAGVTNFCGLHANVHGDIRQVVHGIADELLARIDGLGGLSPTTPFARSSLRQNPDAPPCLAGFSSTAPATAILRPGRAHRSSAATAREQCSIRP
jgi:hypothetical protein